MAAPDLTINGYDFGSNVHIFTSTTDPKVIQQTVTSIYQTQQLNDFGDNRYAFFFLPQVTNGKVVPTTYTINDLPVGFYTQVLGLGLSPDDIVIDGHVTSRASTGRTNVLDTFWRGAENFKVTNKGKLQEDGYEGKMLWAASQACPLRRLHIMGDLDLSYWQWCSSGGYIADCKIDRNVTNMTQQQFFSRSCNFTTWNGAVWNVVLAGCKGAYANNGKTTPDINVNGCQDYNMISVPSISKIRQKPYLAINEKNQAIVVKPCFQTDINGLGAAWDVPKEFLSLQDFYIAKPNLDDPTYVATMLKAMTDQKKKHILFTPGIYAFEQSLPIREHGMTILGIGLPTLYPKYGNAVLEVGDVEDVTISGLVIESGLQDTAVLLRIGATARTTETKIEKPIVLHDIFIRIGPKFNSTVDTCIELNANDTIIDHLWIWRADHGATGTFDTWNRCVANHGLEINGDNVTIYGLFCEHFLKNQTIWNGKNGKLYFYQSEVPYFVPEKWHGYASLKVNDAADKFTAYGLGVYTAFYIDDAHLTSLIEVPEKNSTSITNAVGVLIKPNQATSTAPCSITGVGKVDYVLNHRFRVGKTPDNGVLITYTKGINPVAGHL